MNTDKKDFELYFHTTIREFYLNIIIKRLGRGVVDEISIDYSFFNFIFGNVS